MDDYINIKKQLKLTFFSEKKVNYQEHLFIEFYDVIFPESNEFEVFLNTSGRDVMVSAAKKIVDRIMFEEAFDGLQIFYDNLIGFEEENILKEYSPYVPQDHAIHSVSLYLLGLYLYFNSAVFNKSISAYFRSIIVSSNYNYSIEEKAFLNFLSAWKGFSLLHDIAYPYESLFMAQKEISNELYDNPYIKQFENIDDLIEYYIGIKCFTRIILAEIVFNDHKEKIDNIFLESINKFESINGKHKLSECIMEFKGFHKLRYAHTNSDLAFIKNWFSLKTILIIVKNEDYNVILVIIQRNNKDKVYLCKDYKDNYKDNLDDLFLMNSVEQKRKKLHFDFYIDENDGNSMNDIINTLNLSARYNDIKKLSIDIRNDISFELATMTEESSFTEIEYLISKEISKNCPFKKTVKDVFEKDNLKREQDLFKNIVLKTLKKEYSNLIEQCFDKIKDKNKIKDYNKKISYSDKEVDDMFSEIINIFSGKNYDRVTKFEKECKENFYSSKENKEEEINNYYEIFNKIENVIKGFEQSENCVKYCSLVGVLIDGVKETNILHEILGSNINQLLKEEKYIDPDEQSNIFFKYKNDYSYFDHGIMAGVIVKYFLNNKKIHEDYLEDKGIKKFVYEQYATSPRIVDEMIYAILVHNIYTNTYFRCCQNKPIHSLLINPFSYFGMFCDNLQVWDRDQRINHGLVEWTGNTLYGEDISIICEDKKIKIICKTNNIIKSFNKLKEDLDEYLLNASKIISLGLVEQ